MESSLYNAIYGNIGESAEAYPGELTAGLTPGMLSAESLANMGADTSLDASMQAALQAALSGNPAFSLNRDIITSDYMKEVAQPMLRSFSLDVAPKITESFRKGGLFSQSRGNAVRTALEGLNTTLASGLANRQWEGTTLEAQLATDAANRQLSALPLSEQFATRNWTRAGLQTGVASPFQNYYQNILNTKKAEWERTRPYASPWLSLANQFLQNKSTEAVGVQGTQGTDWGQVGGLITAAAISTKVSFICIPEGSLIDIPKGQIKVEDIKARDLVFDKDKKEVKVLMKYEFDELPTKDRFINLVFEDGSEATVCDMHKVDGIRAMDLLVGENGLVSKQFVPMNVRSYDLLTSGRDGSYCVNGVGVDSMIPELHAETEKMIKELRWQSS